ncbi:uncharacterized protein [Eleutherodactylus coqui]|uniref:uncharacterized protein n=1 Tax=Eleutherodactylus coqui TaxID=57060 RepID=UPI003462F94E
MVDFPGNFTEISVNSSVVVSCQTGYRKKNITLQCREKSGQFLLSPADGDTPCVGVCRKASPWTHMVDFPKYFTEISVNSSVVVSCQTGYREKNITLQCREKSGQFLLSPADGDTPCVGVCRKASPWTHMVDFPENFTEILVNSSVVVSCQQGYREKNITLQCREKSGQFLLSPADGDHCIGVCRKASPWTHMVDFTENFTEISVNSSVVVSCKQEYGKKNITLQCREESRQFLLSPADGDTPCVGNEMLALVRLLLTSTFGFVVPFLVKLLLLIVILLWKMSWTINKKLRICRKEDDQQRSPEERSMNVYWKKPEQDDVSPQREEVQDIYANLKEEVYIFPARK